MRESGLQGATHRDADNEHDERRAGYSNCQHGL